MSERCPSVNLEVPLVMLLFKILTLIIVQMHLKYFTDLGENSSPRFSVYNIHIFCS